MIRVLIIDPQFEGDPGLEREVAGEGVTFEIVRPGEGEVPAAPLRRADAVVNCRSRHRLPAHLVAEMERVKVVVQAGVGFNHIDVEACAGRGIPVCNTPDYGTLEVADHTLGLLLSLTRATVVYHHRLLRRDDRLAHAGVAGGADPAAARPGVRHRRPRTDRPRGGRAGRRVPASGRVP